MFSWSSIGDPEPEITVKLSAAGMRAYVGDRMLVLDEVQLVERVDLGPRLVLTVASFKVEIEDERKRADA